MSDNRILTATKIMLKTEVHDISIFHKKEHSLLISFPQQ